MRRATTVVLAIAALLVIGIPGPGCRRAAPPSRPVSVLLIGLDGASWTFIDLLRARGALPNLDRLVREGVRAPMKTLSPSLSPALWTSMASGRPPAVHGIEDFQTKDAAGNDVITSSDARRTETLWTILSRSGRRVGFVGWWVTWPAEPVEGFVVSDHFLRPHEEPLAKATYPESLAARLDAAIPADWPWLRQSLEVGQIKVFSDRSPKTVPDAARRLAEARRLYDQDHRGEESILYLLRQQERPDLVGFTSRKIDLASHYMWSFLADDRGPDAVSRVLEPVYRYEDALIGRLIDAAGPATHVIVVSDHGFERVGEEWDHKDGAPDGIFIGWGPSFRRGVAVDPVSILDVTPTVLHVLGLPVARDMEGHVVEQALADRAPVKWVATYETGRRASKGAGSPVDEELREQLRALGYIK
jgi:predicted AlkP superfamily phosphohydrolase/phosphomutase